MSNTIPRSVGTSVEDEARRLSRRGANRLAVDTMVEEKNRFIKGQCSRVVLDQRGLDR